MDLPPACGANGTAMSSGSASLALAAIGVEATEKKTPKSAYVEFANNLSAGVKAAGCRVPAIRDGWHALVKERWHALEGDEHTKLQRLKELDLRRHYGAAPLVLQDRHDAVAGRVVVPEGSLVPTAVVASDYHMPSDGTLIPVTPAHMEAVLKEKSLVSRALNFSDLVNRFAMDRGIVPSKLVRQRAAPPQHSRLAARIMAFVIQRLKRTSSRKVTFAARIGLMDVVLRFVVDNGVGVPSSTHFVMPILSFGAGSAGVQQAGVLWMHFRHATDGCGADAMLHRAHAC